jgi:two-component system, LytTR family, sensor kinase
MVAPVPARLRPRTIVLRAAIVLLVWPLIVVAFAAQLVFSASFTWELALRSSLHDWIPWVVISPFVWWLAGRFPLERGRLRWSVPVHVLACAGAVALAGWFTETIGPQPLRHAPAMELGLAPGGEVRRRERERESPPPSLAHPPPGPGRMRMLEAQRRFWDFFVWSRSKLDLPVYWIIVSVTHALAFYRRAEERQRHALELQAGLSQAKLEALRLQLQPHFLFNTLNAISTLVHRDANAADEMITSLSEMLRLSLDTKEQEVPLRRELELLDRYLSIEQVRLGPRLRIERAIDPATLEARVPALMLQTIVENAVRHGIEPQTEAGTITLRAQRVGGVLRLVVADTGVGLRAIDARSERRGIGLANTEARLRELHGDAARLNLREPPEGGVSVEIELPWRTGAPAEMPVAQGHDRS